MLGFSAKGTRFAALVYWGARAFPTGTTGGGGYGQVDGPQIGADSRRFESGIGWHWRLARQWGGANTDATVGLGVEFAGRFSGRSRRRRVVRPVLLGPVERAPHQYTRLPFSSARFNGLPLDGMIKALSNEKPVETGS